MNRENRARLRNMRDCLKDKIDGLKEVYDELDVLLASEDPIEEPTEEQLEEAFGTVDRSVNWTTADDTPDKAGIYIKDLNESTVLKGMMIIGQITVIGETDTWMSQKHKKKGLVKSWVLQDSSGEILVVFWDEQIDKVSQFMLGDKVEITNAWRVKKNTEGILELHPGKFFDIKKVE